MGNSLVVSKPYIIDEYPSDDDDDEENYVYESAYEGPCVQEAVASEAEQGIVPESQQETPQFDTHYEYKGVKVAHPSGVCQPFLTAGQHPGSVSTTTDDVDWGEEERQALAKLDEDLSQFEADEARLVNTHPEISRSKKERSSAIPTFRAINQSASLEEGSNRENKILSPLIQKATYHRVSAIPRLSTSVTSLEEDDSQTLNDKTEKAPTPPEFSDNEVKEENQTIGLLASSTTHPLCQENENVVPVSREIKVVIDGQNLEDDFIKVTDTAAWEINISDFTGRTRKNKKRSGIPSLWTDPFSKAKVETNLPPSPETELPTSPAKATEVLSVSALDTNNPNQRKIMDPKRCLSPLSQEQAIRILGYDGPCEKIRFGPFTGNLTLLRWFRELNNHFKVRGRCYIMFKPVGRNKTTGITNNIALEKLKAGLQDSGTTFIYHCHNHYFCPIGYEESPQLAMEAYSGRVSSESIEHTWILIGDTSRKYGPFHCKSWDEICQDLNLNSPYYMNIRKLWQGVMKKKSAKKTSGNLHCIMCFQRPKDLQSWIPTIPNKTNVSRSSRLPRRSPSPSSRKSLDREFRFSREEGDINGEEDMDEEIETLTSDVSTDEDIDKKAKLTPRLF